MKRTKESLPLGAAAAATAPLAGSSVPAAAAASKGMLPNVSAGPDGSRAAGASAHRHRGPVRVDELLRDPAEPLGELLQLAAVAAYLDRATATFEPLRQKIGAARMCELSFALGKARGLLQIILQDLERAAGIEGDES